MWAMLLCAWQVGFCSFKAPLILLLQLPWQPQRLSLFALLVACLWLCEPQGQIASLLQPVTSLYIQQLLQILAQHMQKLMCNTRAVNCSGHAQRFCQAQLAYVNQVMIIQSYISGMHSWSPESNIQAISSWQHSACADCVEIVVTYHSTSHMRLAPLKTASPHCECQDRKPRGHEMQTEALQWSRYR